jgi:hypothetical protein
MPCNAAAANLTVGVATAQLGGTDNDPTKPASPKPADAAPATPADPVEASPAASGAPVATGSTPVWKPRADSVNLKWL